MAPSSHDVLTRGILTVRRAKSGLAGAADGRIVVVFPPTASTSAGDGAQRSDGGEDPV